MTDEESLRDGETILLRTNASCQSRFVPLGQGTLVLTEKRLIWCAGRDLLNFPFNLWHPEVSIERAEIKRAWAPRFLGGLNVITVDGGYAFQIYEASLLNPLFPCKNQRMANRFSQQLGKSERAESLWTTLRRKR